MNYEVHLKSGTVAKFTAKAQIKCKNPKGVNTLVFYSNDEALSVDKKSIKASHLDQVDAIFISDMVVGVIQHT